jgi:hypothetical protein
MPRGAFAVAREHGVRSSVAAPIVVEASPWGVMVVASSDERSLQADTEARLASFIVAVSSGSQRIRGEMAMKVV